MNKSLLVKLLVVVALVLAVIALLSAIMSGFSAPKWVLPTSAVSGFLGLLLAVL